MEFNLKRKRKISEMALHVAEEAEHPMNQQLENRRTYDQIADKTIFLLETKKRA
jgi:hypothetical protein